MSFYVLDDNNNKIEGATLEEIMALLEQAIEQGTLENITKDSAFVTKVKCCVGGATHHIAFITAAKYNELVTNNQLIADCYYIITDDTTCDDIDAALAEINAQLTPLVAKYADTSRKSEARQYISSLSGQIYNYTLSQSNQPKIDLSSVMLAGKTRDDVLGIGGTLNIEFTNNNSAIFSFSTLFIDGAKANVTAACRYGNAASYTLYLFNFEIGINVEKQLYMSYIYELLYSLNTSTKLTVKTATISKLNIYYK